MQISQPKPESQPIPSSEGFAAPRATSVIVPHHRPDVLRGRNEVVARVLGRCETTASAQAIALTGPAGAGRSAVLGQVRAELAARGTKTVSLRIARHESDGTGLVAGLADLLGFSATFQVGRVPLARLLMQFTKEHGPLVVLVDDTQQLASGAMADLAGSVTALKATPVTFICAYRTPMANVPADFAQLLRSGAVLEERLRPLPASAVKQILADRLQSHPTRQLVRYVQRSSRGLPAFVHAAIEGLAEAGCLQVHDGRVCRVGGTKPRVKTDHPVLTGLAELGEPYWSVVKALAVLQPLRGAVAGLIAAATGLEERRINDTLDVLREIGVLTDAFTFRVPLLAELLVACLRPYERCRASEVAATALLSGTATCEDPDHLPEQLATAGKLVDSERAITELLGHSDRVHAGRGDLADRWGRAAIRLSAGGERQAEVLYRHAVSSALNMRFASAAESSRAALREHAGQLTPETKLELDILRVVAAAGTPEPEIPARSADAHGVITRAAALCFQNRWQDAYDELTTNRPLWTSAGPTAGLFGHLLRHTTCCVLGLPGSDALDAARLAEKLPSSGTTTKVLRVLARPLLLLDSLDDGDRGRALHSGDCTAAAPAICSRITGDWDSAISQARDCLATAAASGRVPEYTALFRSTADILIARGQLHRARAVIADAHTQHLLLPHLLAIPEAELELATGSAVRAGEHLTAALEAAESGNILIGTDELLLALTRIAVRRGDHAAAKHHVARLGEVVTRLGTAAAHRNHLLGRTLVLRDAGAAAEALESAKAQGQAVVYASTIDVVASAGLADATTIRTAYDIFGEVDALIPRSRLRLLMRDQKVPVPGRTATVAEDERLLGTLIAEGLTNTQIASILCTSEKSVEGKLARMFRRAGFRSRAELVTSMLNGTLSNSE